MVTVPTGISRFPCSITISIAAAVPASAEDMLRTIVLLSPPASSTPSQMPANSLDKTLLGVGTFTFASPLRAIWKGASPAALDAVPDAFAASPERRPSNLDGWGRLAENRTADPSIAIPLSGTSMEVLPSGIRGVLGETSDGSAYEKDKSNAHTHRAIPLS